MAKNGTSGGRNISKNDVLMAMRVTLIELGAKSPSGAVNVNRLCDEIMELFGCARFGTKRDQVENLVFEIANNNNEFATAGDFGGLIYYRVA